MATNISGKQRSLLFGPRRSNGLPMKSPAKLSAENGTSTQWTKAKKSANPHWHIVPKRDPVVMPIGVLAHQAVKIWRKLFPSGNADTGDVRDIADCASYNFKAIRGARLESHRTCCTSSCPTPSRVPDSAQILRRMWSSDQSAPTITPEMAIRCAWRWRQSCTNNSQGMVSGGRSPARQ